MALYHIGMRNLVNVPVVIYNVMVKIPSAARNASLRKLTGVNLVWFERLEELSITALCNIRKLTLQQRKMKRMKMKLLRGSRTVCRTVSHDQKMKFMLYTTTSTL
ncbi:hypothetical protein AAC387_Pa03g2304 [Persea americana]